MKHNIGIADRVARFLGGIILLLAGLVWIRNSVVQGIAIVLAAIALIEAVVGYCYLYRLLRINTCGKEKKSLWNALSWVFILCALAAYGIGWIALMNSSSYWVPTEYWFYDAMATGIVGVFFGMKAR